MGHCDESGCFLKLNRQRKCWQREGMSCRCDSGQRTQGGICRNDAMTRGVRCSATHVCRGLVSNGERESAFIVQLMMVDRGAQTGIESGREEREKKQAKDNSKHGKNRGQQAERV